MTTETENAEIWGEQFEALPGRPATLSELGEWFDGTEYVVYIPVAPEPEHPGPIVADADENTRSEFILRSDTRTVMCSFGYPEPISGEVTVTHRDVGWRRSDLDIGDDEFNELFLSEESSARYRRL